MSSDGRCGRDDPSIVVLTGVDGALRESTHGSCISLRQPVAELGAANVPVILASHHSRVELAVVQEDLGIVAPFIAEDGAALCVPRGYFARLPRLSTASGAWDLIEFHPPSLGDAIEMLMWLYRISGESPLLVGVGSSWRDHQLLRHVDVPVVVRNPGVDQQALCAQFPDAYVTSATGPVGWSEAMLGVGQPDDGQRPASRSVP